MEEVGITLNEEGAPKVVQYYNLRQLRPDGLDRHRVVRWFSCGCLSETVPDATFNNFLKCIFLAILSLSVLNDIFLGRLLPNSHLINKPWLFMPFQIEHKGIVLLAVFAVVVCVRAFVKKQKMTTASASQTKEEVQTISASIQQV